MAKFVDYDPERGVECWEDMKDGHLQVHYRQDVEPLLERNKMLRNGGMTDHGIKKDIWHYCDIPPVVILDMKFRFGVDVFNRDHLKRVFQLINTEYPHLKCTEKTHTLKH